MAPPTATKPRKEGRAEIGLKYGPSPRQTIDLFKPRGSADGPLALFIHGGYWRSLEPSSFSQMARGMNAHGVTVAVSGYDLAPQVSIGQIIEQTQQACLYLWRRFKKRIMVSGHSAGGHLAACMVATDWKKLDAAAPADLAPVGYAISGLYDLAPLLHLATNADFKLDAAEARRISPLFWPVAQGPRARRRGRRRGILGVPAAQQDHRRRLAREGRRDALRGDPRHEPLHHLRSDDRSEQRDDEAAGRTGEAKPRTSSARRTPRSAAAPTATITTRIASCGTRRARCAPQKPPIRQPAIITSVCGQLTAPLAMNHDRSGDRVEARHQILGHVGGR